MLKGGEEKPRGEENRVERKRESRAASPSPLSPARSRQPTRSVGVERERAARTSLLHAQRRKSSSLVREQLRKAAHPPQPARAGRARRVQDCVSGEGGVEQGVPILVREQLRSGPILLNPLAGLKTTTRGSNARRSAVSVSRAAPPSFHAPAPALADRPCRSTRT
ncbi:hypothetical protein B0H13DRAFT_2046474 [Mycena leptocephala]|nr:hypothetical protein B0H13DRAFT_2046474 [Mycena leptocephala]